MGRGGKSPGCGISSGEAQGREQRVSARCSGTTVEANKSLHSLPWGGKGSWGRASTEEKHLRERPMEKLLGPHHLPRPRRAPQQPWHKGLQRQGPSSPHAACAHHFLFPFTTKAARGGGGCGCFPHTAAPAPRSAPTAAFVIPQLGLFGLDFC